MRVDREWVEQIVREVLQYQQQGLNQEKPTIHIIHSEKMKQEDKVFFEKRWNVIWVNPSEETERDVERALFYHVEQDLLVKSSLGISDTPVSRWFSKLIRSGREVLFTLSPQLNWLKQKENITDMSQCYADMLMQHKDNLISYGVQFLDVKEVIPHRSQNYKDEGSSISSPNVYSGKLVTQRDLEKWGRKEMHVLKNTIITPLAKDKAKELNITMQYIDA
ncbi:hypothetical protein [Halobacillus yeomjeoni]|uniref:Ethanolamine utilization protein n=1 Tax=Halobacillus yeomjeoni TaxID=311194 RepID=A0A931HUL5_9BACI|nr:hypothetical protein [Halobacillus yeomjeoni]MBH0229713.1 hypothetical protein [Halobacillus yeomjeoni]